MIDAVPEVRLVAAAPAAERGRRCGHCDAARAGRYCHACGQDTLPAETGWQSWNDQWRRLLRTLAALLRDPGGLALEHLAGARIRFVPPFTLFLNAVAVFFLFAVATKFQLREFVAQDPFEWIGPLLDAAARDAGVTREVMLERAERRFQGIYTITLVLVSLAGYTLLYKLFFRSQLPGFRGPFTLALNYLAFIFIFFLPVMMLAPLLARALGGGAWMFALALPLACVAAWNVFAARRVAGWRWPGAIAAGLVIVACGVVIDNLMFWCAIRLTFALA